MHPKVGIIYLTFATPHWQADIDRGLTSLTKMTYPKDRVELICVESASPSGDVVESWFRETWLSKSGRELPRMTYIRNERVIGFAGNNNIGFQKAKELGCDFVYLLNEDAEVEPNFLESAVARMQSDEKIAYVQSLILLGDHERVNTIGNAFH
ncbi:MAG: glycosyltransferase, partial [bacterium]|nr:glycosyltransferase [bacterium]